MGLIDFTTEEIEASVKMGVQPIFFSLKATVDTPMNQTIATANTYQDVTFSNVVQRIIGDLTYDGSIVTYTGTVPVLMTMNLSTSVESNQPNTIVHIGQAQAGVIDVGSESSGKCESNTAEESLNVATEFVLMPGDTLNLRIKASNTATIGMNHFQVVLKQAQIETAI